MYLVYYEVCISISLLFNGYYYIYLEIASFYQMFGIRIFVSIHVTVCDITGQWFFLYNYFTLFDLNDWKTLQIYMHVTLR